jgi:large subunit ribosomal protein L17
MRNLTRALIEHGRIVTTLAKAKEVRPFVERLITIAKRGSLHARRLVLARLRDKNATTALFKEIAPRFLDRPGGYTRIIRRHERRLGDAGPTAFLELLKEGEKKVRARQPQAPTMPRVETPVPTPPPAPEATQAPAEAPPATPPAETPPSA